MSPMNRADLFWTRVLKTPSGCWLWTGGLNGGGYGSFSVGRKGIGAHRFAYELVHGPIPKGLTIDHFCRTRRCVNAEHMEPVTQRVNTLRGTGPFADKHRQTHCIHGHEFTEKNTRTVRGRRECKECNRVYDHGRRDAAYWREYRLQRKEHGRAVRRSHA